MIEEGDFSFRKKELENGDIEYRCRLLLENIEVVKAGLAKWQDDSFIEEQMRKECRHYVYKEVTDGLAEIATLFNELKMALDDGHPLFKELGTEIRKLMAMVRS